MGDLDTANVYHIHLINSAKVLIYKQHTAFNMLTVILYFDIIVIYLPLPELTSQGCQSHNLCIMQHVR